MSRVRVHNFSVSLDGFGTGEGQSLDAPFGHAGTRLHEWFFPTRAFRAMTGQPDGSTVSSPSTTCSLQPPPQQLMKVMPPVLPPHAEAARGKGPAFQAALHLLANQYIFLLNPIRHRHALAHERLGLLRAEADLELQEARARAHLLHRCASNPRDCRPGRSARNPPSRHCRESLHANAIAPLRWYTAWAGG